MWIFSHEKSSKKVEALKKKALRFFCDYYNSPSEEIVKKTGKVSMEENRVGHLCIEIYKSINSINPSFIQQILKLKETNRIVPIQYKQNVRVPKVSQVHYGEKSLKYYVSKVWNFPPIHVKASENLRLSKIRMVLHIVCHTRSR